jgi:excalibur calcium-binding domain-containing protein
MKHALKAVLVAVAATCVVTSGSGSADATAREFANCTAMHRVYPHGVGKYGAHDRTSSAPVTSFKRSNALYYANRKSDRDGDRIACEAR